MYIYANHLAKMKMGMHVSAGISLINRPKAVKTVLPSVLHLFSPLKCVTVIPRYTALTHYCMKCILFLLSLHVSKYS